jgi:hypothetical protein
MNCPHLQLVVPSIRRPYLPCFPLTAFLLFDQRSYLLSTVLFHTDTVVLSITGPMERSVVGKGVHFSQVLPKDFHRLLPAYG